MVVNVNDANFTEEVLRSDMTVLVDFWAPWCGPCQMVGPVIEQIAEENSEKLKVCKVNVDEAPSVAASYGVMSIPTISVFKNGKEENKTIGALPKAAIMNMVSSYI